MTSDDDGFERPLVQAMRRGFGRHCPRCGEGALFRSFLRVTPACPACGLDLSQQRADDAPPYFTIMIVGHIIVPLMLMMEKMWQPDTWVHMVLWLPLAVLLSFWLLPRIKGAIVGLQWAKHMHGFGPAEQAEPG